MGEEKIPNLQEIKKFLSDIGATMTVVFSTETDKKDINKNFSHFYNSTEYKFEKFIKKHKDARIS